jgi:hypothetical protein
VRAEHVSEGILNFLKMYILAAQLLGWGTFAGGKRAANKSTATGKPK